MNRSWRIAVNVLIESGNGLVVDTALLQCSGTAERDAAMIMAERVEGWSASLWPRIHVHRCCLQPRADAKSDFPGQFNPCRSG
jgi:hypothetical protein